MSQRSEKHPGAGTLISQRSSRMEGKVKILLNMEVYASLDHHLYHGNLEFDVTCKDIRMKNCPSVTYKNEILHLRIPFKFQHQNRYISQKRQKPKQLVI